MAEISENYGPGEKYAKRMCKGYAMGGGIKKTAKKAVVEHEDQLHAGKHAKLKLKCGGGVKGAAAAERPDRRARGGKIGTVVINVRGPGGDPQADAMKQDMAAKAGMQKGVAIGAQMAKGPPPDMPPGPPGAPPPGPMAGPGGPPGGLPPMMPRARGGKVNLPAGAGSGLGRIEKANAEGAHIQVKAHSRRRGGSCS